MCSASAGAAATSPAAKRPGTPGTRSVSSTTSRPSASVAAGTSAVSALARMPAVHTTVRAASRSPLESVTPSGVDRPHRHAQPPLDAERVERLLDDRARTGAEIGTDDVRLARPSVTVGSPVTIGDLGQATDHLGGDLDHR